MRSSIRLVIPALQTPSGGKTAEALRQEVVQAQLLAANLPHSQESQEADGSVVDTSSEA